jgi:hypothetical protein
MMADNPDPGGGRWRKNRKNNKSIQQEKRSHEEAKFEGGNRLCGPLLILGWNGNVGECNFGSSEFIFSATHLFSVLPQQPCNMFWVLFILIQNQCSESLMQDITGSAEYQDNILPGRNGIELLKLIRDIAQNLLSHVYTPNTIFLQMRAFYNLQ